MDKKDSFNKYEKRIDLLKENYLKSINLLKEALEVSTDRNVKLLAVNHAFVMCYELLCKVLKSHLALEGVQVGFQREIFRESFKYGILKGSVEDWLAMMDSRNAIVREYIETVAEGIYEKSSSTYLRMFKEVADYFGW